MSLEEIAMAIGVILLLIAAIIGIAIYFIAFYHIIAIMLILLGWANIPHWEINGLTLFQQLIFWFIIFYIFEQTEIKTNKQEKGKEGKERDIYRY